MVVLVPGETDILLTLADLVQVPEPHKGRFQSLAGRCTLERRVVTG